MSDFILDGDDYVDLLKTPEHFEKFKRLKEIWEGGELAKHPKDCLPLIIEFDNLRQDLHGEPRHTFLIQNNPILN
jgi:hypothetical protein